MNETSLSNQLNCYLLYICQLAAKRRYDAVCYTTQISTGGLCSYCTWLWTALVFYWR